MVMPTRQLCRATHELQLGQFPNSYAADEQVAFVSNRFVLLEKEIIRNGKHIQITEYATKSIANHSFSPQPPGVSFSLVQVVAGDMFVNHEVLRQLFGEYRRRFTSGVSG